MMNWRRLSSLLLISLSILIINLSCEEEQLEKKYIVKVGNAELTEDELNHFLDSSRFGNKHREEIIRNWIDKEIFYQEALNIGLEEDPLFQHIQKSNEKELLSSLLIQREIKSANLTFAEADLERYFENNLDEFRLNYSAVMMNRADFTDKQTAINFRSNLVSDGWKVSIENFENEESFAGSQLNNFIYKYQLKSARLLRVLSELMPDEYSIVVEAEPNLFSIVQLIKSFEADEIPQFEFVRDLVLERYLMQKKKEFYSNYKKELYNKYKVEIVRND